MPKYSHSQLLDRLSIVKRSSVSLLHNLNFLDF